MWCLHFQIKGKRGYVPSDFVREYKVLKSSLEFLVSTEESENVRDSSQERVTDKSLKNASNSVNIIHETSNLETILNDVEHSGLEPDPRSGIQTSTPSLDDSAVSNLPVTDVWHPPFFGSGVSAEPIESEKSQNPEDIRQLFEVVDGTTLYHETDGKQTESNLRLPEVQPTSTTSSSLPSVVPEMESKSDHEAASVPPFQLPMPFASTGDGGGDSAEYVTLGRQLLEKKEEATVVKLDHASDERKTESISVVDKKETDSVTGTELTSVEEHKQEAENVEHKYVSSVDVSKSKTKVNEDEKEEIIEEPHMAPDKESEGNEEDDKEEDEEDEYDDEEDEDIEEEVNEEVAQLPSTGTDAQKLVEEVEVINTVDGPTKPADSDALKVEDQGIVQPTLETDTNMNSVFINNSKVDDPNLQEIAEVPLVQVHLPENITDSYRPSKEVATDEPLTLEHPLLPAAERQDAYGNANHTESSVGSVEELEGSQIGKTHESVTEGEGSGTDEHLETQQAVADTGDQLHSLAVDDKLLEGKEVIDDSNKVIRSVPDSDYPEYISGSLKTHPELALDKIADYNSELSSELKGEVKSNLSEEPYTDSTQEEIAATTAASSEEEYYGVPIYGSSTEEPSTTVPTSISEEPLVPVEGSDLVSNEPSGGLLSGIMDTLSAGIGVLTSMFGGSSADSHIAEVPEEVNESNPNVVTDSFPHKDQAEDMNTKRDAAWSSLWGGRDRGHIVTDSGNDNLNEEKERMCKLNSFNLYLLCSFIKNLQNN